MDGVRFEMMNFTSNLLYSDATPFDSRYTFSININRAQHGIVIVTRYMSPPLASFETP